MQCVTFPREDRLARYCPESIMPENTLRADARRLEEIRLEIQTQLAPRYTHLSANAFKEMVAKMAEAKFRLEKRVSGAHRGIRD